MRPTRLPKLLTDNASTILDELTSSHHGEHEVDLGNGVTLTHTHVLGNASNATGMDWTGT